MHEKWLTEEAGHPVPAPVLTVDADKPAHLMQADFDHVRMRIDQAWGASNRIYFVPITCYF